MKGFSWVLPLSGSFVREIKSLAKLNSPRKFYIYATFVGLLAGAIGALFTYLLVKIETLVFLPLTGVDIGESISEGVRHQPTYNPYWILALPVLGGVISGWIVQKFDEKAAGGGTDTMIYAYHEEQGKVHWKTPLVKFFATLATLGSGGSGGKEGPIAQVGSGIGSFFAQKMKFGAKATRSLFLAGMAGALGAVFLTPLGAAVTAVEVIYKEDFESEALLPSILASVAGYFIYTFFYGIHVVFHLPESSFHNWSELLVYVLLGVVTFVFGWFFVKLYKFVLYRSRKSKLPLWLR
ncbi:MAG: chloride channel protein, partial [Candidatus Hydrogenedentota bacterium]